MDRRLLAIACVAIAAAFLLLQHFYKSGNGDCFGPGPVGVGGTWGDRLDYLSQSIAFDNRCHTAKTELGLEIGATMLVALGAGLWIGKRQN